MESRLQISIPRHVFNSPIDSKILSHLPVSIVIHKSPNLMGTLGIAKFGPKWGQVFQSNIMSLC